MSKKIFLICFFSIFLFFQINGDEVGNYTEIGVSVFTPAGINLMYGYSINNMTYRISGMYLNKTYGFQFETNFNLKNTLKSKSGPGLILGYVDAADTTGNFQYMTNNEGVRGLLAGAHYFWNPGLFYISVGLAATLINPNTEPPIALLFNIGINKRLIKK